MTGSSPQPEDRHGRCPDIGVLLALGGVALFTPVFAAGKFVDGTVPALAIIAARYVGGVLTLIGVIAATRTPLSRLKSPQPHWHVIRALLGSGGGACAVYAASAMPIADATAIGLVEGLLIVAFAVVLLGESVSLRHWLAGLLCAIGAVIVVHGATTPEATNATAFPMAWLGALAAFAGAVLIALETILIKVLARRETALGVLIHVNTFGMLLMLVPGFLVATRAGLDPRDLLPFLVLGPVAITAQYLNILALRYADAAIIGPVSYSWIVFAALLGYAWFGEVPTLWTWIGSLLIVAGGIWLSRMRSAVPR